MNAGPVWDRVYAALRERILGHHYRPGARLDVAELAAELASSTTPVRDALNRLAGEGLVEAPAREGFHLPAIDEPGLADLYRWSNDLLQLATAKIVGLPDDRDALSASGHVARTSRLFAAIAAGSDNLEHARALDNCSARLSAARLVEPELLPDLEEELARLAALYQHGARKPLRVALRQYHARRIQRASGLVRFLYRSRQ
jgi:DNA-binding GntR family transcriptional regulator